MEMASVSSNPRTVEEIFKDFSGRRNGIIRALTYGTRSRFLFIFFSFIFGHFYLSIYLTFFLISQISSPLRCGRVLCALRSRYFFRHASLNPFVCFYGFVISWMMGDLSLCGDLNRANQGYCCPSLLARIWFEVWQTLDLVGLMTMNCPPNHHSVLCNDWGNFVIKKEEELGQFLPITPTGCVACGPL